MIGGRQLSERRKVLPPKNPSAAKHMSKGMALAQKRHFAGLGKVETAILGGAKPVRAA
jgi:hypothetical protein